jgi:hypothetical protein
MSLAAALLEYASSGGKSLSGIGKALAQSNRYPSYSAQSRGQAVDDSEGGGAGGSSYPTGRTATLIEESAQRYGLDPQAMIAVALGEGGLTNREGDIGDLAGGGSYGPFQLYAQGALPAKYRGNPKAADAWAWSPQGVDYAARQMAKSGARGLRGAKAVETIIRRFERPADPDSSVRNALARYGSAPVPARGGGGGGGGVRELFYDPAGAYDEGKWIAPIGGHDDHVHVSYGTPGAALSGIRQAQRMGLSARENPYTDPVDPVHTKGSYHYSNFSGSYGGRKLGRGLDVSGPAEQLRRYFDWVKRTQIQGSR